MLFPANCEFRCKEKRGGTFLLYVPMHKALLAFPYLKAPWSRSSEKRSGYERSGEILLMEYYEIIFTNICQKN